MIVKEQVLGVEIIHECFTDESDSILTVYFASLSGALQNKFLDH